MILRHLLSKGSALTCSIFIIYIVSNLFDSIINKYTIRMIRYTKYTPKPLISYLIQFMSIHPSQCSMADWLPGQTYNLISQIKELELYNIFIKNIFLALKMKLYQIWSENQNTPHFADCKYCQFVRIKRNAK